MRKSRLPLFCLFALLLGLAGQQIALATPYGFLHDRVRQELREKGQAKVIVTLADEKLPQARAADWRQRVRAIEDMRARVMKGAPRFKVRQTFVTQALLAGAVDSESLKQLQSSPLVTGIYPDRKYRIALKESGPLIGQPQAQVAGFTGHGVSIALVDSGIDYKHADFGGTTASTFPTEKVVGGWDFVNNDNDLSKPPADGPMDDNGHGTHVAGIAAGTNLTYRGIAPDATLVAYKVVGTDGGADTAAVLAALDRAIQERDAYNIKVINLSLSDGIPWASSQEFESLFPDEAQVYKDVVSNGMVIVAASGNEAFTDGMGAPAIVSSVISVGATYDKSFTTTVNWGDCKDTNPPVDSPVCFSTRGELIDLYAPGAMITSARASANTDPPQPGDPSGFITEAGTSSAAPHVSGAAACVVNMLYPDPTVAIDPAAVRQRLKLTGVQVVDPTTQVGTPRADVGRAINPPASGPDLVVTAVSTTAGSAFVGDSVPLSITIANQGDVPSPACRAIIVLSSNDVVSPQDHVAATIDVPVLVAGGQYSSSTVTGVIPGMGSGAYTLGAFADSTYIVAEKNEINNGKAGGTLSIGSSAAVVSNDIPPSMVKGHSYTISVTVLNDSAAPWVAAEGYQLTAVSPVGTARWGSVHIPLPGGVTVNPTETTTFIFDVTAPITAAWVPCHWQMSKGGHVFGGVATGGAEVQVTDDLDFGQDYPSVNGDRVAYEDYRDNFTFSISVTDFNTMGTVRLPKDIPFPLDPQGYPLPPFEWTTDPWTFHQWPSIWGSWVSWMADDMPDDPSNPTFFYYQVLSYNLDTFGQLPVRLNYDTAHPSDQGWPCVDGHLVVYEDYRSDANRAIGDGLDDNADIYIADLSAARGDNNTVPTYPICTAPGPQFNPRISGSIVVWEDWRNRTQPDIFMYDLSVDTDGNGVPNWKEPPGSRPSPDPAETRLTSTPYPEEFPAVSGRTVVWMDMRRDTPAVTTASIDIYALDLDTMTQTPVATDPPTYRYQPRIDNRKVVWTDFRYGWGDIYWADLDTGVEVPIAGSSAEEDVADISGNRVVYSKLRETFTYNILAQQLLTKASVGVHTFTDVNNDFWAWKWIEAIAARQVAAGYPDGTYGPAGNVTRDQMAVYIARALEGGDSLVPPGPATASFSDVPADYWAYKYVEDCVKKGVVQGYPDGTYQPTLTLTRGAMAVFIARAVAGGDSSVTGAATPSFSDVPTTYWAFKYVEYCASPTRGIVKGFPDGTYRPEELVTRDQMAVYIARAFKYVTD